MWRRLGVEARTVRRVRMMARTLVGALRGATAVALQSQGVQRNGLAGQWLQICCAFGLLQLVQTYLATALAAVAPALLLPVLLLLLLLLLCALLDVAVSAAPVTSLPLVALSSAAKKRWMMAATLSCASASV